MKRKRTAPKAQPDDAGTQPDMRWEREVSGNQWQVFPPEQNEVLSQAARLSFNHVIFEKAFGLFNKQNKTKNNFLLLFLFFAHMGADYVWEWEGDKKNDWIPYPATTCLDLWAALNGDRKPIVDLTFDATEAEVGSQLSNSDLDAGMAVPAKKCQTELDAPASQGQGDGVKVVKTLTVKGKAPVDPECTAKLGKAHVYCEGDDIYNVMLNQTNLQFNNNKYYLIQLLEEDNARNYSVWMRWGREKTKNEWDKRASFQKAAGKYDLLHLDYKAKNANNPEAAAKKIVSRPKAVSQLDLRVQALIELICSIQMMEEMVIEMKYDTRKAPLGKLTAEQIQAGYWSLQKVEAYIKWSQTGSAWLEACNEFYTRIPHDFGLKTPPPIKTLNEVQEKAQLLEALSEIRIGIKHVQGEQLDLKHPLDQSYRRILSQGLRVAPPEAPVTGYMVALGECNELLEANPEAKKLLIRKHSTKGLGKLAPAGCISLHGATVPMGPAKPTGVVNPNGYTLNYNEFVVYDPRQVRMKYLLKVRFNFTQLW
ncbi:putative Poly [ADP-ribose] polymerase protein [Naja naja]|nr:putative Poly [ADP-ribose] polymerase protein [Naja naja]